MGVQVGLVVGGGNIFVVFQEATRYRSYYRGDSMGMLATVINGLALMDRLKMGAVVQYKVQFQWINLPSPIYKEEPLLDT